MSESLTLSPVSADGGRSLNRGGIALVLNSGSTALLGVLYWLAAAHLYRPALVGRNSALVSALLTVSGFAQCNFARSLSGLLPSAGARAARLLGRVYLLTAAIGLVLGLGFAVIAPLVAVRLHYVTTAWFFIPGFTVATLAWTVFTLEDTALASVRSTGIIPFENAAFGLMKIGLLFVFHRLGVGVFGIFASWILPLVIVIPAINLYLFRRALPRSAVIAAPPAERTQSPRAWVRHDFVGYLFWVLGTLPLPFLVDILLGPVAAAAFYVPFTIVLAIDVLSLNVGNTFTAEMQRAGGVLGGSAIRFLLRLWGLVLLLTVGLAAGAPYVLGLFGAEYRARGHVVFLILLAAVIPRSVMFFAIAADRARGRGRPILILQALASAGTIVIGIVLGKSIGLSGIAWAWLGASGVAAVLAVEQLFGTTRLSRR